MHDVMEVGFDAASVRRVFDMMSWGLTDSVVGRSVAKPRSDDPAAIADRRGRRLAAAAMAARAELARVDQASAAAAQARHARLERFRRVAGAGVVAAVSGALIYSLAVAGIAKLGDPPKRVNAIESAPVLLEGSGSSQEGWDDPYGLIG